MWSAGEKTEPGRIARNAAMDVLQKLQPAKDDKPQIGVKQGEMVGVFLKESMNLYSEESFKHHKEGVTPEQTGADANMFLQGPHDSEKKPYVAVKDGGPLEMECIRFRGNKRWTDMMPYHVRKDQSEELWHSLFAQLLDDMNMLAGKQRRWMTETEIDRKVHAKAKELKAARQLGRSQSATGSSGLARKHGDDDKNDEDHDCKEKKAKKFGSQFHMLKQKKSKSLPVVGSTPILKLFLLLPTRIRVRQCDSVCSMLRPSFWRTLMRGKELQRKPRKGHQVLGKLWKKAASLRAPWTRMQFNLKDNQLSVGHIDPGFTAKATGKLTSSISGVDASVWRTRVLFIRLPDFLVCLHDHFAMR